jgi:hypothetical protein
MPNCKRNFTIAYRISQTTTKFHPKNSKQQTQGMKRGYSIIYTPNSNCPHKNCTNLNNGIKQKYYVSYKYLLFDNKKRLSTRFRETSPENFSFMHPG